MHIPNLSRDRLLQPWIYKDPPAVFDDSPRPHSPLEAVGPEVQSSNSSMSLGDTHVWRDMGNT